MVSKELMAAGYISLTLHLSLFFIEFSEEKIRFDVIRGESSVELSLVSSRPKRSPEAPQEYPVNLKQIKVSSETFARKMEEDSVQRSEESEHSEMATASPEFKGAILETEPSYLQNSPPLYPRIAVERGYEGMVILKASVLKDGSCGQIEILNSSGHQVLDRAALKAVEKWKFVSARRGMIPISSWVNIPIRFKLVESKSAEDNNCLGFSPGA